MNIKNGKIKNINKKIVAGTLVFVLVAVPLTGCNAVSIDDIKYIKNEQGYVQSIDSIRKDTLKYCGIYKVRNIKEDKLYYTICLRDDFNGTYEVKYYDIFTGEELKHSNYSFHLVEILDEYLVEDKETYKEEELREILNIFVDNLEKSKKLVKE